MGLQYLTAVVADLASKRHTFAPDPYPPAPSQPSAVGPGLLFFGGVLLVALIAYLAYAAQRARRQGFQRMATQLNLSYSQHDPFGVLGYPFTLFTRGDERKLENVVSGAWQEVNVIAFDFMYAEGSGKSRTEYSFDCADRSDRRRRTAPRDRAREPDDVARRRAVVPRPTVRVGSVQPCVPGALRRAEVRERCAGRTDDAVAAGQRTGFIFEVVGDRVLIAGPRIKPPELVGLLGVARGFAQHVPKVVSSLYPG